MENVRIRYIVEDADAALPFYTEHLGFQVDMHPAPGFAITQPKGLGRGGSGTLGIPYRDANPGGRSSERPG